MKSLALSFLAGTLTILSPCILPILPIVVMSALKKGKLGPIFFGLGLAITFAIAGVLISYLGSMFGLDRSALNTLTAILLILFGASLLIKQIESVFSKFVQPISSKVSNFQTKINKEGLGGQFILGCSMGLVWIPCTGPTLGAAAALAANGEKLLFSFSVMLFFALGSMLPLLIIAYGFKGLREKFISSAKSNSLALKKLFGVVLLSIGILMLSGYDKKIEGKILDLIPEKIIDLSISV